MKSNSPKRIGVLGHYGNVNLGDEASFAATVRNIRNRFPDAELVGFTLYPESTQARTGVRTYAIRRTARRQGWSRADAVSGQASTVGASRPQGWSLRQSLKRIPVVYPVLRWLRNAVRSVVRTFAEIGFLCSGYAKMRQIDTLWIAGSNQVEDAHGTWGYPYTLFKWTLLARLAGVRVLFVSVGASPLQSSVSRFFQRRALGWASSRSFRSINSKVVVEQLGVKGINEVQPDLAYNYPTSVSPAPTGNPSESLLVAINPMAYYERRYWPIHDEKIYREYVAKLAEFSVRLLRSGHRVMLFPTQLAADPLVIDDVMALIDEKCPGERDRLVSVGPIESVDDLLAQLNRADITVVTRFHGVIFSHVMHRPVIALSYEQKIDDAMAATGHSAYCIPIRDFSVEHLHQVFVNLVANRDQITAELSAKTSQFKKQLEEQYERLLANY